VGAVGGEGEASILVNVSLLCCDNDLKYSLIGCWMNLLRECMSRGGGGVRWTGGG
jgi:hypothetical protein